MELILHSGHLRLAQIAHLGCQTPMNYPPWSPGVNSSYKVAMHSVFQHLKLSNRSSKLFLRNCSPNTSSSNCQVQLQKRSHILALRHLWKPKQSPQPLFKFYSPVLQQLIIVVHKSKLLFGGWFHMFSLKDMWECLLQL